MKKIVKVEENSDTLTFSALLWGYLFIIVFIFSCCVYKMRNALRMEPFSKPSGTPIVGKELPHSLSISHLLFPCDVFMTVCPGLFLKQLLLLVLVGGLFLWNTELWHYWQSVPTLYIVLSVAPTAAKMRTMLLKTSIYRCFLPTGTSKCLPCSYVQEDWNVWEF